jgi:hypothetical protein
MKMERGTCFNTVQDERVILYIRVSTLGYLYIIFYAMEHLSMMLFVIQWGISLLCRWLFNGVSRYYVVCCTTGYLSHHAMYVQCCG